MLFLDPNLAQKLGVRPILLTRKWGAPPPIPNPGSATAMHACRVQISVAQKNSVSVSLMPFPQAVGCRNSKSEAKGRRQRDNGFVPLAADFFVCEFQLLGQPVIGPAAQLLLEEVLLDGFFNLSFGYSPSPCGHYQTTHCKRRNGI